MKYSLNYFDCYLARISSLAFAYSVIAKIVLDFFSTNGVISIFWPLSGFALGTLLLGGRKYWPGIFLGAWVGNVWAGSAIGMSVIIALGNTLEAVTAVWLLTVFTKFNVALLDLQSYFKLAGAAVVSSCVSALNGTITLFVTGILLPPQFIINLIQWWQGDVLGIILVTPMFLVWRKAPQGWFDRNRIIETIAFIALAFIVGQLVFIHWQYQWVGAVAGDYWMFLFVMWGAIRFGRHGSLLVIGMAALQALVGAGFHIGYFGNDIVETNLNNFWFYMLVLSLTGTSLAVTMDQRLRAESNALRMTRLYKALSETNQAIVRMGDKSELFPLVCRCAVEYGEMKMAWIGQIDESTHLIIPVAHAGEGLSFLDGLTMSSCADLVEGQGPTGVALRKNQPVIINDYQASLITTPWKSRIIPYGWKSTATFPILYAGQSFAVLSVYQDRIDAFDDESVDLLTEMSSDISFALDNFDREQQRKTALEQLDASQRHYATLLSVTPVGVFETDKKGQFIYVNSRWLFITGLPFNSAMGDGWLKSLHSEDLDTVRQAWAALINAAEPFRLEYRVMRSDGSVVWVLSLAEAVFSPTGELLNFTGTITDITQNKRNEELIWRQANFDAVTGLPNRSMFMDRIKEEIKNCHRTHLPMALLFLDLDRFKEINDTLGHGKGDILLKAVAQRLSACVRKTDMVARMGGDEFTIIVSDLHDRFCLERVAQHILKMLENSFNLITDVVYVSASIGITLYPDDGHEIETLLKNADQAMYAAKKRGRNCFNYFTPSMQDAALYRMRITNDLRDALANNQLIVYYQPIVELKNGSIHKAEALVRWQHPIHGLISPAEFIPIAEETGQINDIGNWVFRQAAQQAKQWQALYCPDFQISINTSPVQFRSEQKKQIHFLWSEYLQQLGLSGQSVVAEITEGLLMDASETITNKLLGFRDAGIQVSLDDFGTGYSSLSYLKKFHIDYLKIDQSFVRHLSSDSDDMALCTAIICMAHQLDIKVIAEGVETEEQRNLLTAAGCDYSQGYLCSKPVSAEIFEVLLKNNQSL